MAQSTCGKCGKHNFEIKENTPENSGFKLLFVQCKSCGVPISTISFINTNTQIDGLSKQINIIKSDLESLIRGKL